MTTPPRGPAAPAPTPSGPAPHGGPHEAADLAAALGRIPSGLFVVTWRTEGADRGMLASWVMQAGFEPPLVSVAVGSSRDLLMAVRGGAAFVVNVLADSQKGLLGRFGKPPAAGEDPFAGLAIERTPEGVAALADAAAWLACRPVAEAATAGSDHVVVVGRVEAARGTAAAEPLVHVRRNGLRY
jgi:flavin reductase (DIM6/NTAB) family NADH-FMN oxidoreductase RutF